MKTLRRTVLILLIVPAWLLSGCVGEGAWFPLSVESKVGDSFEKCVENEGTVGLHFKEGKPLVAEWVFTSRGPACRIVFDEQRKAVSVEYTIRNYCEEAMP